MAHSHSTYGESSSTVSFELPEGDFKLIEQAARARLSGPAHEEVELTTELIVAAKESPGRLDRKAIDAILGVVVPPAGAITRD